MNTNQEHVVCTVSSRNAAELLCNGARQYLKRAGQSVPPFTFEIVDPNHPVEMWYVLCPHWSRLSVFTQTSLIGMAHGIEFMLANTK